jgi:putative FmdB family regulatory protein
MIVDEQHYPNTSNELLPIVRRTQEGGHVMPLYDYKCLKCGKECLLALTLKEHESKVATCPSCGSKELEQLITSFIARTSSKS